MKKQQKEKPPPGQSAVGSRQSAKNTKDKIKSAVRSRQSASNTNNAEDFNRLKKQRTVSRSNLTKAALNLANQEIERLKKLIDKRVREIAKLRKNTPPPA